MNLFFFLVFLSISAFGETRELVTGRMEYQVGHLLKTVSGTSDEVKGKMECDEDDCAFLLGAKVSSFTSSDSNRDTNMLMVTEAGKFPVVSAGGKIPSSKLREGKPFTHEIDVTFHGVVKTYAVVTEVVDNSKMKSRFSLKLDQHSVDRPSLFGVKIHNEVPLVLETEWRLK